MDHVLLLDMAIHGFDALRAMTGLDGVNVYCREWNPPSSWYRQGSSAAAIFELDNRAPFIYRGSWCAPGLQTSWECGWRFVGTRGLAHLGRRRGDPHRGRAAAAGATACSTPVEPVEPPPLAANDRIGGHFGVLGRLRRGGARRRAARDGGQRQHPLAGDGPRGHRERGGSAARQHHRVTPMRGPMNEGLLERYQRDGYLVIEDLVSPLGSDGAARRSREALSRQGQGSQRRFRPGVERPARGLSCDPFPSQAVGPVSRSARPSAHRRGADVA